MTPSFFNLFKRGRYFRPAPHAPGMGRLNGGENNAMKETERFAAAAIAFAWRHDEQFRQHFWRTVCHFDEDPDLTEQEEILIEPYRWADLLITNRTSERRYIHAIELKINAGLQDIQNPACSRFTSREGYGRLFKHAFEGADAELRYVVLGHQTPLKLPSLPARRGVRSQQRQWKELAEGLSRTTIAHDLALSLGRLGIGAFPSSEVKDMKIDTRLSEIGKAATILPEVLRRLDWPSGRSQKPGFGFDRGEWYLGVELLASHKEPAKALKSLVKPPSNYLAWFGYLGEGTGTPRLGVWLYCSSSAVRRTLATRLRRRLKDCQLDATRPVEWKQFHLVVTTQTHTFNNDCEWFCSVFHSLNVPLIC